jgi:anthranilate synthase/aminodeoxychorismate synthase-like glutamine amidotransferase
MSLNVLLVDNFDSFTFNLVDELRRRDARVEVYRNDLSAEEALGLALALPPPRMIAISPGPGRPEDAGCCQELIGLALGRVPIFGVCLGLQAMVQALGGKVGPAGEVVHGKSVWIEHSGAGIFEGLPSPMLAGRYHSLAARELPDALDVTARTCVRREGAKPRRALERSDNREGERQLVMAVTHRSAPLAGVQFHPESILTPQGGVLLQQTIAWAEQQQGGT